MQLAAISFDLDGTLADTAPEIAEAVNRLLLEFRREPLSLPTIARMVGAGMEPLVARVLDHLERHSPEGTLRVPFARLMQRLRVHYDATTGRRASAFPGAAGALAGLREAGFRLACVTNKDSRYASRVLAVNGLDAYIDLLVGGDSLPVRKPDARTLQHVLDRFDLVPAQLAHVGDSVTDVECARNAGVAAWALPYGYNAGLPIRLAKPDRIFDSFAALGAHVLAQRFALTD